MARSLPSYLEVIDTLTEEIDAFDERIEDRANKLRETRLLMTIPWIAHYSRLVFYVEIGDISRFNNSREVVRYIGLNPVMDRATPSMSEAPRRSGRERRDGCSCTRFIPQCTQLAIRLSVGSTSGLSGGKAPKGTCRDRTEAAGLDESCA